LKAHRVISRVLLHTILLLVILYYVVPLLVMVTTSIKPESQILTKRWQWIPETVTLENYVYVLRQYPFIRWLVNSIVITTGTVLLTLAVSLPAGYAFARLQFRGKEVLFVLSLLTIMIPFFAYIPQLYLLFYYLKLTNTYVSLMIPPATSGVSLFLFRQFISQIPTDLDDAAKIDGCSHWRIFLQIILPLTKPAVVAVVIFTAIKSWNSLLWPLIAASGDRVKPLPVGLAINVFAVTTGIMHQPPYGVMMAASLLSIALPVLLFLVLQRYFVMGIATTGLK
jgi:multiple sugar transport system permease protein